MTSTTLPRAPRAVPPSALGRSDGNGGIPARRAITRWAWRLFRREWRQQILVLLLLTFAVGVAVFGASAAYNLPPLRAAEFGTADEALIFNAANPAEARDNLAAARKAFGTIDVIGHRDVDVPGSVDSIDFRSQDPRGAYGAPMLALRSGRYPTRAGDVAVTDAVAKLLDTHVGGALDLGGRHLTVVGLVENPNDLGDEFALVSPSPADPPQSVTVLFRATAAQFDAFRSSSSSPLGRATSGQDEKATAAVVALAVSTVMLLLVALVAAAGFVVVAQRRQRQLGMLAAIGATERHLRLVMLANGAVVGVIAAVIGTAVGLAVRIGVAPLLETAAGHRIGRFDLPWWVVAASMLLAVLTATAAAWLPARNIARLSITQALSARPTRAKPAWRSAAAAGMFIAI
ncbi:MAG: putative transport system permease protein, partial [Actinomycetota bacterium]|nr:putative transport system permease protein [Actinomycetota bacterium]